nr:MAG TPA: hypothetical protein [Caudoviricetes sp.]
MDLIKTFDGIFQDLPVVRGFLEETFHHFSTICKIVEKFGDIIPHPIRSFRIIEYEFRSLDRLVYVEHHIEGVIDCSIAKAQIPLQCHPELDRTRTALERFIAQRLNFNLFVIHDVPPLLMSYLFHNTMGRSVDQRIRRHSEDRDCIRKSHQHPPVVTSVIRHGFTGDRHDNVEKNDHENCEYLFHFYTSCKYYTVKRRIAWTRT